MSRSAHETWQELVTLALVGTARRMAVAERPDGPTGPLETLLATIEARAEGPEAALLGSAAAVSAYRRAGALPSKDDTPLAEPAPRLADDLPACSRRAGQDLAIILSRKGHLEILPEWLAAVEKAGLRVRDEDLPALLDLGRFRSDERPALAAVLGALGRWLAAQNRDWSYALRSVETDLTDAEARWQTEGRDARIALIRQMRGAEPDRARALVESTWKVDPPADRAAFLEAFATNLEMADEPFLEAALDDGRAEVRRAAVDLLTRLSGSQLCKRMIDRLTPLVRFKGKLFSTSIEIELPSACTKEMARDGVSAKVPGLGEKVGWLSQMVAAVPPTHWWETAGIPPEKLIATVAATEWGAELLGSWAVATAGHRDARWAKAFLRGARHPLKPPRPVPYSELIHCLSDEERRETVTAILESPTCLPEDAEWLEAIAPPWDDRLGRTALDFLSRVIDGSAAARFVLASRTLSLAATRMPPGLADEIEEKFRPLFESAVPYLVAQLDETLQILHFRREMIQEFSP